MKKNQERQTDSNTYRRIFEFVQKNGIDSLVKLAQSFGAFSGSRIIEKRLFYGQDLLSHIVRDKELIGFLRGFKNGFLKNVNIYDSSFEEIVDMIANSMDKLDLLIENAKVLEDLRVGSIKCSDCFMYDAANSNSIQTFFDKDGKITDIVKPYSDGKISYTAHESKNRTPSFINYSVQYADASFILIAENHGNGNRYIYAHIKNFEFNASKLPSYEEISSMEEIPEFKGHQKIRQ